MSKAEQIDTKARRAERAAQRRARAASRRRWRASQSKKRVQGASSRAPAPEPAPRAEGSRRTRQGLVVSDKGDKTIVVRIDVTRRHPVYKKILRESSKLHAHDERNEAHTGDTVRVLETRPLSRTKRWRLDEILERAR